MYKVLRKNLESFRLGEPDLYFYIENGLDIHLGVADKKLLLRELQDKDHPNFYSLWQEVRNILFEFGYNSEKLKQGHEEDEINYERWARRGDEGRW